MRDYTSCAARTTTTRNRCVFLGLCGAASSYVMTLHYECDALTADESYVCITMTHTFRPAVHSNACSCSLIGLASSAAAHNSCSISSCPVNSCPLSSCLLSSCPISSCPVNSCPLSSCQLSSCPLSSCPLSSCPLSSCLLSSSPLSSCQLSSCPLSSCLLSSCPLCSCLLSSCQLCSCSPDVTCCCCFQLEELPKARERISALEQRNENLEAVVKMKQDYERYVTSHGKPCSALTLHSRAPLPGRGG